MRPRLAGPLIVAALLSGVLADAVFTQQQPPPQEPQSPDRSLQVAVPQGRGREGGQGRGRQAGPPPGPVPRLANGRPMWGQASLDKKGVWLPGGGGGQTVEAANIPFQTWAKGVYNDRLINQLEPHTRCKPSGAVRQFLTPYGVEFTEFPEMQRIYIFDIGGPHTYRTIYTDGRPHPPNLVPSYYGHSIGRWEGDTLIVDTVGYNETFWIDRRGLPTTEKLHTIEKFTRTDSLTIKYELTVDDPGAYTETWTQGFNLRWEDGTELFEYVCQQQNYAPELMLGGQKSIDRSTPIIP